MNLNNLKDRIEFVVNGGKVRGPHWPKDEFIQFTRDRGFVDENGKALTARETFLNPYSTPWYEYIPVKSEEDERDEFIRKYRRTIAPEQRADLLFDTFERKKKV